MIKKIGVITTICVIFGAGIIWTNIEMSSNEYQIKGVLLTDFPDNEICSLGCGVGWETYGIIRGKFSNTGYTATIGDVIEWRIDPSAKGDYRFDGFYCMGSGLSGARMFLNGVSIPGAIKEGRFKTDNDYYVKANDVISVEVTGVIGNGLIESIQPTGVH